MAPLAAATVTGVFRKKIPASYHIGWFNTLALGGSAGLAIEHAISGEITPFFPFLTALSNPTDTAFMVHEIMTEGLAILLAFISIWAMMLLVASYIEQTAATASKQST